MNRQQKAEVVDLLKDNFSNSQASFLVGFKGLTVAEMQNLRAELRKQGGRLKVTKARLMKRASEGGKCNEELAPFFKGQVGLVFATKESPAIAKVLFDYAKDHQAFHIVAGCLEDKFLDKSSIARIATLPSREVLLAQVAGTIKAPISGFVTVLNMQMLRLLWTLKKIEATKQ
ncbi:MAG TPA: 50S ribosomal protein L10 [Candidatus Babeliales bacterium]|nr:50S ribosomal protein L10 [Candidatus Babeliales bacterium]